MRDRALSLLDRFILFYLQHNRAEQKYMPVDRLELRISRNRLTVDQLRHVPRREFGTISRQDGGSPANFCGEGLIFQGAKIDLHIGKGAGQWPHRARASRRGQVGFHVGIGDGIERVRRSVRFRGLFRRRPSGTAVASFSAASIRASPDVSSAASWPVCRPSSRSCRTRRRRRRQPSVLRAAG